MSRVGGEVDVATVPVARADVASVSLDGETVLHRRGHVHVLDPVATLVWRSCDGGASVDEIAADLAEGFGAAPATVRRDVIDAVAELARLDLLLPEADDGTLRDDRVVLLADPPGSCASCAERPWTFRSAYRVGERIAVVGTNSARADAILRVALGAHVVPVPPAARTEPPFYALDVHDLQPDGGPQRLHLLQRAERVIARSRRADRVVRALVAHLASYGALPSGLAPVDGLVVGRDGRAMILAPPADPVRLGHALARHGVRVAAAPVALVAPDVTEVVVGPAGLLVDDAPIGALAEPGSEREPEPLPWGRYELVAIGVPASASPSSALLALGPEVGDHRDHDRTLDALVALLDAVPVVDASDSADAAAIATRLGG
jgi:hypothetical protein